MANSPRLARTLELSANWQATPREKRLALLAPLLWNVERLFLYVQIRCKPPDSRQVKFVII